MRPADFSSCSLARSVITAEPDTLSLAEALSKFEGLRQAPGGGARSCPQASVASLSHIRPVVATRAPAPAPQVNITSDRGHLMAAVAVQPQCLPVEVSTDIGLAANPL